MNPPAPPRLPFAGRVYVATVGWLGLAVFLYSAWAVADERLPLQSEWLIFAALTIASGRFTLKMPSVSARFSVSEMFGFITVLLFGPESGAVILAIDGVIVSWRHRMSGAQTLFNFGNLSLAVWTSGSLFFLTSGAAPLLNYTGPAEGLVLPLTLLAATYFLINTGLTAVAIGMQTGRPALHVWRAHFLWVGPGYAAGASVALLLVVALRQVHFSAIALLVPLVAVCYLMLRSSFGRLEDTEHHVAELNALYMSTIETLATAIDAKDDVTHDHVRRVQGAAVALAHELGLSDPQLLKAIEAAGLLHDTGKIAVPEHILNKPGKLTAAEFEKMKLHAPIGAEILSSIRFPYPVVPIVRHHHENWDGTGYPDGLRGTDIPIGARILSIVDCFDALTSDRPYRGRMSDEDAIEIVRQRRGTMYDPLIVDTFIACYQRIMPAVQASVHPAAKAVGSARVQRIEDQPPAAAEPPLLDEVVAFTNLSRVVGGEAGLGDVGALVWLMVRQLVPASALALFVYDEEADEMVAHYAAGSHAAVLRQARYGMASGPVGWTAVNHRPLVNAEAMIATDTRQSMQAAPHWVCTVPLIDNGTLQAVLALYAPQSARFTEQQAGLLELLAPKLASAVAHVRSAGRRNETPEPAASPRPRAAELRVVRRA